MKRNLKQLFINQLTGKWAIEDTIATSIFNIILYTQDVPSDNWLIPHEQDSTRVLTIVLDSASIQIVPDKIELIDSNNTNITFSAPQSGSAYLIFF